ncbi:hypothetical protein [Nitrospirillum amazonense]|uniref:Uncharacterized protein n=1 Tax=Nitrospirillum amazonense TaxID=28077 RepID=A0A560JV81_9PROT|nr:hypothetical protein [Nitrospirillum amazonense]MDG3440631.1 hypothetical protein [Nitrospirillum amazonense]MEC4594386.1 hypothetical protein [Nitrospirillum amazonense]TWB75035.1 hypothetical protein FBZ87_104131 [Nitrospirillum amazonense]
MDRYTGKPFLRLIECYILDLIDQLEDKQRATLKAMEPNLQKTYSAQGTWQEIVAAQMAFTESFNAQVRTFWNGYLNHARANHASVHPEEFVISLVDQNFNSDQSPR